MDVDQIQKVRSFNRTVTRRIGALDDSYMSRGRPLGEARLIFEIGPREGIDLRALRSQLGLDSGYLSRLLRSLEGQGLVRSRKKTEDGRVRELSLTAKGRREWQAYDTLSDDLARAILFSMNDTQRAKLVAAMTEVERLIRAAGVTIAQEPAGSDDAQYCLGEYRTELASRFDGGFDPSKGNNLTVEEMTPPAGYLLVARLDGKPIGCGALKRLDAKEGEVKRVWTSPDARGLGVASRMMDSLEQLARDVGFRTIKLDTNRTLTEAQAMYRKRGYRTIGRYNDNPYAHHWFEKDV
jgi:DNA-binding MarR family transcriptional regulator/GNAT superfamily N-acetyltransferase